MKKPEFKSASLEPEIKKELIPIPDRESILSVKFIHDIIINQVIVKGIDLTNCDNLTINDNFILFLVSDRKYKVPLTNVLLIEFE